MGNLLTQSQKLYAYNLKSLQAKDIFVPVSDLLTIPQPIHGKILISFTQAQEKQEFIKYNHHKVVLIDDSHELKPFLFFKFRGLPIINEQQLAKQPQNCLKMHFNCKYCNIPLILERFSQNLLSNYINAFHVYGINVQYYERLEVFLRAECQIPLIVCSNFELQQLSLKIQNLTYRNFKKQKLTILCFCNKDQYTLPKRTEVVMQGCNIEVILFQNMLQIIQKINKDSLQSPFKITQKSEKILFYVDQKEKQVNYLSKMAKRIQKLIRYSKVQKITDKNQLIQQIKQNSYSIVVIGKDSKQMKNYIEIEENLQQQGLEDRVIFIRRDAQFNDRLIHKIQNVTGNPSFVCQSITQKQIVFYGTLDSFKNVIKYYPKINFKKFIDSSLDEQSIISFLRISTEVIMTHLRICDCMDKWKDQIKCKIILVKNRLNSYHKKHEKGEINVCLKEYWYHNEEQLLNAFQSSGQELYGVNFNPYSKKMTYISGILSQIFTKFKQKKSILTNQLFGTIFLFSCEYYFFDQISNYIVKYFSSKTLGNYDKPCQFQHLKLKLYQELLQLNKSIGIEEQVLYLLEKDQSSNVFQLADRLILWVAKNQILLDQINNIWELFIYRDRPQHLSNCYVLLFLLLLAYNKTNFVKYHNQTLQNVTLKIKQGLVSCDKESQNTFTSKIKNSYVYNFSFLLCQQVKADTIQQPGEIYIRIDGSELNNFGLFLPIWRNESTFLIAPLTKFQHSVKAQNLRLKISLNTQQKLLQKFSQYFLTEKAGLKLFKEQRQMRKLDCFLENMSNGKLQTAGYILSKMIKQSPMKNADLINAYVIFHHLKRGQIDQAYTKLRHDKYYEILSILIASCREGSSVEAAHSSLTNDQRQDFDIKQDKNNSLINESQSTAKRSILDLSKGITNQFKVLPPKIKRNPSQIIVASDKSSKGRSKRLPVPIKHNRGKGEQKEALIDQSGQQRQVKIKILPPALDDSIFQSQKSRQNEDLFLNINSIKNLGNKKSIKQLFHCSLSRLNSNSYDSQISQFIQFEDPIIQSADNQAPLKRKRSSKKDFHSKPSNFLIQNSEAEKKKSQQSQPGTASSTGKFNFQRKKSQGNLQQSQALLQEGGQESKTEIIEPALQQEMQQEIDKHSDSSSENREKQSENDFFKFSLGVGTLGKGLFNIKKKTQHFPRDSINFGIPKGAIQLQNLIYIEQESLQLSSNQNIFTSLALSNSAQSNKQNIDIMRSNDRKLFTFCKIQDLPSTEFGNRLQQLPLLSLKEQSLVSSNDSMLKQKKENTSQAKKALFSIFDQVKEKISQTSISSIDIQEQAQPVHPQELIQSEALDY